MLTKPEFQSRIRDKENHHFQATCFKQDLENVTKFRPGHLLEPPKHYFFGENTNFTRFLVNIDNRC